MNILLVDDHPMTIVIYETMIRDIFPNEKLIFYTANTGWKAQEIIVNLAEALDIAIIDYNLPDPERNESISGLDVAIKLRSKFPLCSNLMITAYTETLLLYSIMKKKCLNGLITKAELSTDNFKWILEKLCGGHDYYSPIINKALDEIWKNEILVEDNNRKILFYLSRGYKIKDIGIMINISTATVQYRVNKLKKTFGVNDERDLVKETYIRNFLS